jgi:peptidoglycan/xylan/chitin deacetylase (PgdA/CDA1 family)
VLVTRTRIAALGSLIAVAAVIAALVFGSTGGGGSSSPAPKAPPKSASASSRPSTAASKPGTTTVPILTYHVINAQPPQSTAPPALYVPASEFSAQMNALKTAGWHAVTLNQLQAYWTHGVSLGTDKPIVITFDNGYASQFTNALPVLKGLGWVGVANIQVSGLPPSDGGLTDSQIRGLIAAGWELDSEGAGQADLTVLGSGQLSSEIATARQTLQSRYGIPVNWFSYPLGDYNTIVIAGVRAAGFVGSTTVVPGWANPQEDRFRLPRLQVVGGISPTKLLSQIAAAEQNPAPPATFHS